MKFEEAIEKINDLFIEPCIPGYSSGDFAPEFFGQIEDLEEIIEDLQETYAPKIKMTESQKIILDLAMKNLIESSDIKSQEFIGNLYKELQRVSNEDEDYQFFLNISGYQYAMIIEHPELIDEVENDI